MNKELTKNYSDVFFSCFYDDATSCGHQLQDHSLTYIYEGELEIESQGKRHFIRKNQCVFLRRDYLLKFTKKPYKAEQYKGISMILKRNKLRDFFKNISKKALPAIQQPFKTSVIRLKETPTFESFFLSLTPYLDTEIVPLQEIIEMKIQEAILALLQTDERFYSTLFDFNEPWKMDILEFMNQNYMHELSISEIAQHTGRSLATFKRDFAKISDLSPKKWLIGKRLEVAYRRLQQGEKPSYLYSELGFKSLSHFYQAFKNEYGFSIKEIK